jgi:hypothetical protein
MGDELPPRSWLPVILMPEDRHYCAPSPLAGARFTPITNFEGAEEGAEISPDGKLVAFLSDHDGEFDIWLTQVGTGQFTNLTRDFPPLGGGRHHRSETWLYGRWFGVVVQPGDRKPLLLMPFTGGTSRVFLRNRRTRRRGPRMECGSFSSASRQPVMIRFTSRIEAARTHSRSVSTALASPRCRAAGTRTIRPGHAMIDGFISSAGPSPKMKSTWMRGACPSPVAAPERLTDQHAAVNYPVLDRRSHCAVRCP